jgi:hypothetical protein
MSALFLRWELLPSSRITVNDIPAYHLSQGYRFVQGSCHGDTSVNLLVRRHRHAVPVSLRGQRLPPGKRTLWSGRTSTRRSTSLAGPASPLAMEPKTRTVYVPCRAAMRRISSRFSTRSLAILIELASHILLTQPDERWRYAHRLLPSFALISYLFFCPAHDSLGNSQGLAIFFMTYRWGKTRIASEHRKAGEACALADVFRDRLPNVFE